MPVGVLEVHPAYAVVMVDLALEAVLSRHQTMVWFSLTRTFDLFGLIMAVRSSRP